MERTVRALRAPTALIDRAEREERLPPGAGLLIVSGAAFMAYAVLIAVIA